MIGIASLIASGFGLFDQIISNIGSSWKNIQATFGIKGVKHKAVRQDGGTDNAGPDVQRMFKEDKATAEFCGVEVGAVRNARIPPSSLRPWLRGPTTAIPAPGVFRISDRKRNVQVRVKEANHRKAGASAANAHVLRSAKKDLEALKNLIQSRKSDRNLQGYGGSVAALMKAISQMEKWA